MADAADIDPPSLGAAAGAAARLGIFGGSFDPPHAGHLYVAREARRVFALDHVVFVPAARPPHKPDRALSPGVARVRMLELLLDGAAWASVWAGELGRAGPSYTADTVDAIHAARGGKGELFLLLGSDNLEGLAAWHRVEDLLARVRPVVVFRGGEARDPDALRRFSAAARARLAEGFLDVPPFDASSTRIRSRLEQGEEPGPAVPPALAEYLATGGFYGGRDDSAR